jgi:hypothetical protein
MVVMDADSQIPRSKLDLMAIVSNQSTLSVFDVDCDKLHRSKAQYPRSIRPSRNSSVLRRIAQCEHIGSGEDSEDSYPKVSTPTSSMSTHGSSAVRKYAKRIRATLLFLELEVLSERMSAHFSLPLSIQQKFANFDDILLSRSQISLYCFSLELYLTFFFPVDRRRCAA